MAERKPVPISAGANRHGVGITRLNTLNEDQTASAVLQFTSSDMERFGFKNDTIRFEIELKFSPGQFYRYKGGNYAN